MKRFLIVEDEHLSLAILNDYFSSFAKCDTATNGKIAYQMFEKAIIDGIPYDLICSDVVMPEMDGHELVRKIRETEKSLPIFDCLRTKVFMISSSGTPSDLTRAILDNDCDDYIVKPFMREHINQLLKKYKLIEPENVS